MKFKRIASIGHISITSRSPFHVYYMSFRRSRSQESNAWNGVWIGAETKKLWPWKTTTQSWAKISQLRNELRKFRSTKPISHPFRSCKMSYETHLWHTSAILQPMPPSSQLRTTLRNHLQAANEVVNHLQVAESSPSCEITSKLQNQSSNLKNG